MSEEINIGERVLIDNKAIGTVIAVGVTIYQVQIDGYDYSDNPAYEYHNISKERCKKLNPKIMRIRHIKTDKEGEPMANPEMEYPDKLRGDSAIWDTEEHAEMVSRWHSGLLPFEDREEALKKCYTKDEDYDDPVFPGEIVPVDLEVEVVEQYRNKKSSDWYGYDPKLNGPKDFEPNDYEYRKVLRIKP